MTAVPGSLSTAPAKSLHVFLVAAEESILPRRPRTHAGIWPARLKASPAPPSFEASMVAYADRKDVRAISRFTNTVGFHHDGAARHSRNARQPGGRRALHGLRTDC